MAFKHTLQAGIMKLMSKQITTPKKNILELVKTSISNPEKISVDTPDGEISVFVYTPNSQESNLPIYLNIHGGGFFMNYALQDDHICKYIVEKVGCIVINPDYDTAPKHKFPVAHNQCIYLYEWILSNAHKWNGDSRKIAIGGQSAGGNISLGISVYAHKKGIQKPLSQIIIYPPLDQNSDPKTKQSPILKPLITADFMDMSNAVYFPNIEHRKEPLASPYFLEDLSHLPQTLIITAEYDTLKEEGEKFAERLKNAGVKTIYHIAKESDHFYTHNGLPEKAKETFDLMVAELKSVFN